MPVITSRRDGMVFMIDEGVTGFLIEPDDTEALRKRIVELLTNDERNQTMGEAGKLVARQRFTQAALATTMTECYAELV